MQPISSPISVVERVRREVERNALRVRNGIRLAAGISPPGVGQTPKEVVWRRGRSELWRYRSDHIRVSPPLLIVYSLFNRSYILDLRPGNSFVEHLLNAGFDVYLLDFGIPDERDAANTLDDYADDYLPAAAERVRQVSQDEQVYMLGYCFGGAMFSSLGFTGEALLRDHIRDRNGELHDLVMLAHFVDGMWAGMGAIGLSDELGLPEA